MSNPEQLTSLAHGAARVNSLWQNAGRSEKKCILVTLSFVFNVPISQVKQAMRALQQ